MDREMQLRSRCKPEACHIDSAFHQSADERGLQLGRAQARSYCLSADALAELPDDRLSFLLFPVEHPELFDAVTLDSDGRIERIEVKSAAARSRWIWGAFKMPGRVLHELEELCRRRHSAWVSGGDPAALDRPARSARARGVCRARSVRRPARARQS